MSLLFPFIQYWWFYLGFSGFILLLVFLDIGFFQRKEHSISNKEALVWSIVWVSLALIFNYFFYYYSLSQFSQDARLLAIPGFEPAKAAGQVSLEFITGFLVEKSLAVDNLFIFVVIFKYFSVPKQYQPRILLYGIMGALVFRAIFIALGAALMQYHAVIWIFGGFLIFTGLRMAISTEKEIHPEKTLVIRLFKKFFPVTHDPHGKSFWIRRNGKLYATPLLVALLFLEFTDIIFAVDSVPAIFALTKAPLIVFTSNIFAILGLRSLYFLLANVIDRFHLLKYGLAIILIFVGLKMTWFTHYYQGQFPTSLSLSIILGVLLVSITLSFLMPPKKL